MCRPTLRLLAWLVATVPNLASAAAQGAPAASAAPRSEPAADSVAPQDPERRDNEPRRTGLGGWIRERLRTKPETPDHGGGFSPSVGTVVSGSGLGGGAQYRRMNMLPSGLDAQVGGRVSLRGYQEYSAALGWLERDRSTSVVETADTAVASLFNANTVQTPGTAAYVDLRYRIYPRHRFFGSGMNSNAANEGDYTLSGTSIDGVWRRQFTSTLGLSVRGGWLDLGTSEGHDDTLVDVQDRFVPLALPGSISQTTFLTLGAGVAWDVRDNPRAPARGWFTGASMRRFTAVSDGDPSFTRVTIDVRTYRPVPRGVIALRGLTAADIGGGALATPFYLQMWLGGPNTLRGFHAYRFADRALAHGSVEYRWRAHRYIEIAPFVDAGTVASSFTRLAGDAVEMTPGVGIRGRNEHRVFGRLDWSHGRDGHRVTLGVGPAF